MLSITYESLLHDNIQVKNKFITLFSLNGSALAVSNAATAIEWPSRAPKCKGVFSSYNMFKKHIPDATYIILITSACMINICTLKYIYTYIHI